MPPRPAPPGGAIPPGPTLLQVQCGSCGKLINVHAAHLETLMHHKSYKCPTCRSQQTIDVDPAQEAALLAQARAYRTSVMVAAAAAAPPAQGFHPYHHGLASMLQRAAAAGHFPPPRPGPPPAWGPGPHPGPFPLPPRGGGPRPRPPFPPGALPHGGGPPGIDHLLPGGVDLFLEEDDDVEEDEVRDTFQAYRPAKLPYGAAHPDPVVETSSLAAVEPPDVAYELAAWDTLVGEARLSALQLEAVVYACQRHEQRLPSGARGGFFIGDGAGVGKGRTIAGLIVENWARGRRRHLWVSVGADLKFDARRDLDDAGAAGVEVHALNKLPYGKLAGHKIGVREGVVFLTYSSLVSSSDRGRSRLKQLVEWCGPGFDGLVVFDESHKAKNLVPEAGGRATQVGLKVAEIQAALPDARVVYCSATGASEPRNMGYMTRLGLWGEGHAGFPDFSRFMEAVAGGRGGGGGGAIAALELVAMDMKAQGMYVCRTLSFHGAEFETVDAPLEEPVASQYAAAAAAWNLLYREFLAAEEVAVEAAEALQDGRRAAAGADSAAASGATASGAAASGRTGRGSGAGAGGSLMWRSFWAAHQRFFRHMCMAAKVPAAVRMARAALAEGKCVVIGLQSTGEARTADVVAERGEELDDFVSGPKELLLRLVDGGYPLPANPLAASDSEDSDSEEEDEFDNDRVAEAAARGTLAAREKSRRSKSEVRYREFGSDEEIGDSGSEGEGESGEEGSEEEGSGSDSGSAGGSDRSGGEPASGDGGPSEDGTSESSGADSDPEFDPTAAFKERQRQREEEDASLNTQQRAEKAADEETRRQRRDEALQAYSAAVEARTRLREAMEALELPANPLDDLIDRLGGPAGVAEMTGRKVRLVRDQASGTVRYEPRNASGVGAGATLEMINVHERGLFLDGTKLVAVISEAASAGISLHADRRVANRRRRVHLTLELPWSADKAIQQFGRSHRANQASGPQYRLVFTPLGGERRFAAAVARRLQSLGALTQGDRRAGPSLAAFNYESSWGQRALREMYGAILEEREPAVAPAPCRPGPPGAPPPEPLPSFLGRARAQLINAGVLRVNRRVVAPLTMNEYLTAPGGAPLGLAGLEERERGDVPRFLNRLLGLDPAAQADLFDFFQATMDDLTERARREGTLDEGVVDLKAHSIRLEGEPRELSRDPVTGATAVLHAVKVDRGLPFEAAAELLEAHKAEAEALEATDAAKSPAPAAAPAEPKQDAKPEGQEALAAQQGEGADGGSGVKRDRGDGAGEGPAAGAEPNGVAEGAPTPKKPKTEGEGGAAAALPAGPSAKPAAAGGDVVDLTKDSDDSDDAAKRPKALPWASGFYKGRQEVGGRVHMLLALNVPGSHPDTFAIIRPGTGRARKPIPLRELRDKYLPVSPEAAAPLWGAAFRAAGEPGKDGRPGMRHRTVHILCGAVMGCWGAAQRAMARKVKKAADRRMRVIRIATSGEESQRLVGMLVPEEAVRAVVAELEGGGDAGGDGGGDAGGDGGDDGDAGRRRKRPGVRSVSIAEPAAGDAGTDVIVLD